jgi:hypothetical protein
VSDARIREAERGALDEEQELRFQREKFRAGEFDPARHWAQSLSRRGRLLVSAWGKIPDFLREEFDAFMLQFVTDPVAEILPAIREASRRCPGEWIGDKGTLQALGVIMVACHDHQVTGSCRGMVRHALKLARLPRYVRREESRVYARIWRRNPDEGLAASLGLDCVWTPAGIALANPTKLKP